MAVLAIILIAKFSLDISTATCILALLGYAFMSLFRSAIQMSFHERNFQHEPYTWYREV